MAKFGFKPPVKVRRWQIYHYYGFDFTELHLLSKDSIAASLFENIWLPHSSQMTRTMVTSTGVTMVTMEGLSKSILTVIQFIIINNSLWTAI